MKKKPSYPPRMEGWEYQYQRAEKLERQNADLLIALQALGVTPYDHYCFCPPEMVIGTRFNPSGGHTGECREAQQAIAAAEGNGP